MVDMPLFKQPSNDPTIVSDSFTPAVEGYFRIPAVWIGEKPDDAAVLKLNPSIHHAVVVEKDLRSGIKVRVQRDGTFLFDFSIWKHAPQIEIPGYRHPGPDVPHRPPVETEEANSKSERYAVLRAQVMNVHQACLATSEMLLNRASHEMGLPLISSDALKGLTFEECILYREDANARSFARDALNNRHGVSGQRPFARHVLDTEVVIHSLDLLDTILLKEDTVLIQMSEAVYMAGCRCAEGRFGEAVTLAWGVCEQLLSTAWETLLEELADIGRMPSGRKRRLNDRDYTASIKIEFLEIGTRLDHELYQHLEEARKARNRWVHDLKEPDGAQLLHAIQAVEGLLRTIHGLQVSLPLTYPSPGVPAWNRWVWEQVQSNAQL